MRLNLALFFFITTTVFYSCSNEQKPECLISKAKMGAILAELHLSEKKVELMNFKADTGNIVFHSVFKAQTLSKHNVDTQCFETSYSYYKEHLTDFADIYKSVVDSLSVQETIIEAKHRKSMEQKTTAE